MCFHSICYPSLPEKEINEKPVNDCVDPNAQKIL